MITLHLEYNRLTALPKNIFNGLINLEKVFLTGNLISNTTNLQNEVCPYPPLKCVLIGVNITEIKPENNSVILKANILVLSTLQMAYIISKYF